MSRERAAPPGSFFFHTPHAKRAHPEEDPSSIASPEEVAEVAVFLASDEGRVFSGAALDVVQPK